MQNNSLSVNEVEELLLTHPKGLAAALSALSVATFYKIEQEVRGIEAFVEQCRKEERLEQNAIYIQRLRTLANVALAWHITPEAAELQEHQIVLAEAELSHSTRQ